MSLTPEAEFNRKWRDFPHLARPLGKNRIDDRWYGYSSASDNIFNRYYRTLEIFAVSIDYLKSNESKDAEIDQYVFEDLIRLSKIIDSCSDELKEFSELIYKLSRNMRLNKYPDN